MGLKAGDKPIGAIVWSGKGDINENFISVSKNNEFIITPGNNISLMNTSDSKLMIFSFEPIKNNAN